MVLIQIGGKLVVFLLLDEQINLSGEIIEAFDRLFGGVAQQFFVNGGNEGNFDQSDIGVVIANSVTIIAACPFPPGSVVNSISERPNA